MRGSYVLSVKTQVLLLTTLLVLNFCHWAGDYTHLSTSWMLRAKQYGRPLLPIFLHAMVHAILSFTAVLLLYNKEKALFAAAMQLPTHFAIDVAKGKLGVKYPQLQDPDNKFHWYVFGADQWLHHAVIVITALGVCKIR